MSGNIVFGIEIKGSSEGLVGSVKLSREEFRKLVADANQAGTTVPQQMARMTTGSDRLVDSLRRIGHYGAGLAGLSLGSSLIRETIAAADAMTNLQSRIRLVTEGREQQVAAEQSLFVIAQNTRQSLTATGDLYFKVAKGADALGLSQREVLTLTQTVSQAIALSGSSAETAKATVLQFGQALASGALRGDELNSVMEGAPALAEAIAKGMGKTTGELRALGEQGKITVQEIVQALQQQAPAVEREFARLTPTVGQSWTVLENAVTRYIGQANEASGVTGVLSQAIVGLGNNLDSVVAVAAMTAATGLGGLAGAKLTVAAASINEMMAARAAAVAYTEELAASVRAAEAKVAEAQAKQLVIAASREAAIASLAEANATLAAAQASGAQSAALRLAAQAAAQKSVALTELAALGRATVATETQLTAATLAQTSAQAALTARTAGGLGVATAARAVMGALGGPIGLVTTALTLGATAWVLWGNNAISAADKAAAAMREVQEEAARTGRAEMEITREKRDMALHAWEEANSKYNNAGRDVGPIGWRALKKQRDEALDEFTKWQKELTTAEQREKNIAARLKSGSASSAFDELYRTPAERKRIAIAELDAAYNAEVAKFVGNEERQLKLAEQYKIKRAELEDKFAPKTAKGGGGGRDSYMDDRAKKYLNEELRSLDEAAKAKAAARSATGDLRADFQRDNEAKQRDQAIMSQGERELGDALRNVEERAQRAKESVVKLHAEGHLSAAVYQDTIKQIATIESEQKDRVRDLADEQDRLNASWEYGASRALKDYESNARNVARQTEEMFNRAFSGMEDALVKFVRTGKLDFRSLADSIIEDLIRIQIRAAATQMAGSSSGVLGFLGGLFGGGGGTQAPAPVFERSTMFEGFGTASAKGNVFSSSDLHQHVNTIVDRPTYFAKGGVPSNVMGEAGPEAIMPLRRDSTGRLGVAAAGGGGAANVIVNVIESPGNGGQTRQRDDGGKRIIDVMVEQIKASVAGDISRGNGAVPSAIERTYGLNRTAGAY